MDKPQKPSTLESTAAFAWAAVVAALRGKTKARVRKAFAALALLESQVDQVRGHLPQTRPTDPMLELAYVKIPRGWGVARGAVDIGFEWWCGSKYGWVSPHDPTWQYEKFWNEDFPTLEVARRFAKEKGWE